LPFIGIFFVKIVIKEERDAYKCNVKCAEKNKKGKSNKIKKKKN
jgi:hypothetical protein